jgi:hypothetical protein
MITSRILALSLALVFLSPPARADPPVDLADLPGFEPPIEDLVPRAHPFDDEPSAGTTLSVGLAAVERPEKRDLSASILLTIPTDFFASPARARPAWDGHDDDGASKAKEVPDLEPPAPVAPPPPPHVVLPHVRRADVRAAVAAAAAHAGLDAADAELDDAGTRARWSALLPEVRLRATRLVDEQESLSPTEYDPTRTTASGGASLWLEARGTWTLDRLAFGSEELRIEKLRIDLREARAADARRTVALLFAWQRSVYALYDPAIDPERCLAAWLQSEEEAAAIDVATDGWLERWLRAHPLPAGDCTERDEPSASSS